MRPVQTHIIFKQAIDTLTCVWGGLIAPRLCQEQLESALAPYDYLISFQSSVLEDTHLSKENYLAIALSDERTRVVGIYASCMTALFAFESLKTLTGYEEIKNKEPIRLLGHLRNASAHGNKFHFYRGAARKNFVDPGVLRWRSKTVTKALQDTPAFPDFFSAGDFAYLFEDISVLLK